MKRRTAILLFGTLSLSMGGYVAWCLRPFYLPPPLKIVGSVSPGGREAVEEWRWADSYFKAPEFDWSVAWWNLSNPWNCQLAEPVEVEERPTCGLWARRNDDLWGFSKTGGEWDASTAYHHRGSSWDIHAFWQGEVASRIEILAEGGATFEVLSLGNLTNLGGVVSQAGLENNGVRNSPGVFYDRVVLGRVIVDDSQVRQRLVDALARSIREGFFVDDSPPRRLIKFSQRKNLRAYYSPSRAIIGPDPAPEDAGDPFLLEASQFDGIVARLGIILTQGDVRREYLVSFDDKRGEAFDDGNPGFGGSHGVEFMINGLAKGAFDDFFDLHGIASETGEDGGEMR